MWFFVPLCALIVFLATGSPLAGAVLPFLTAGWPCTRTAFWLRIADPIVRRGRTLFWFYLAAAAWHAAASALLTVAVLGILHVAFDAPFRPEAANHLLIAMLIGLALTTALGLVAVTLGMKRRIRAFVIPDLCARCGGNFAAIIQVTTTRQFFNHAILAVASALLIFPIVSILAILLLANQTGVIAVLTVMVGPIAIIPIYIYLSHRIIALTPFHCWPELFITIANLQRLASHLPASEDPEQPS